MADLFHRVSIRKFKDEAVSNEDIGYILEAAMAAPSAKNQQPWEFYVVENREVLKQLGESSPFSNIVKSGKKGQDEIRLNSVVVYVDKNNTFYLPASLVDFLK